MFAPYLAPPTIEQTDSPHAEKMPPRTGLFQARSRQVLVAAAVQHDRDEAADRHMKAT